jgi:cysteine desulfurase
VAIIAGFGIAAELALLELETEIPRLMNLRQHLFNSLRDRSLLKVTGSTIDRLPHHLSFIIDPANQCNITGKSIVRQLNLAGIGISAGAACSSGKLNPSPILLAMGYSEQEALRGIRITLGKHTTLEDINWTAMVLKQILDRLCPQSVLVC